MSHLKYCRTRKKRAKIADKIREFADVTDEVVKVLKDGLDKIEE